MAGKGLFLLTTLLFPSAFGMECVTFDLENDLDDVFTSKKDLCENMQPWDVGNYTEINMDGPNAWSTSFVSPQVLLSCVMSFEFPMQNTGEVDVNVFMENARLADQIIVLVHERSDNSSNDSTVAMMMYSPMHPEYEEGWHTLKLSVQNADMGVFNGYVSVNVLSYFLTCLTLIKLNTVWY